ncbi:MAG TPA: LLM class flavin-dependent oxidoreductase [Acidimicrobiia bacterium]|nr:LLM class flavin-dependent oxidoreductase [Acidimicrobiia bacterium]
MRFGVFLAPFHAVGQNPTLALERDLDLLVHLDRLGFDEAWIGEHHSGGVETIASPEVFIAAAAERTRHLRLGSGVNSLPYHHPLLLADRFVMLDHLTRGRAMLGCGPGQLTSDAHMLGIPPKTQRARMDEALDVIVRLLRGETVTAKTDWFEINDARLQLAPFSQEGIEMAVAASISPAGPRAAGKHGLGLISIGATTEMGFDILAAHWDVMEERAAEFGQPADRARWRLVGPMHLAETKEQAQRDVEFGILDFARYFRHVLPASPVGDGDDVETILQDCDSSGFAIIGTPDDAIRQIERLVEQSGGFGTFLVFGHEWADPAATRHSYELFARHVMPHFQGQLDPLQSSYDWLVGSEGRFVAAASGAIDKAIQDHAAERAAAQSDGDVNG